MTERLDRVLQLDPPLVDIVPELGQRLGDILGGDRAEQLAFLPRLPSERQRQGAQCSGEALGLTTLGGVPIGTGFPLRRDALLVAFGRLVRQAMRQADSFARSRA